MSVPFTTDATFADDVLAAAMPVLVDFTAPWCQPCKMMAPVVENLAVEQAARMKVIALDVDENPVTTDRYNVMGMPTLGLFIGGELVATVVGGRPGWAVMQALEPHLPSAVTG
jgi:thioredoxin 1